GLRLVLHHEVEGEPTVDEPLSGILLSDTEVLVSELLSQQGLPPLEPFGRYQASLVGVFGGSQPDPTASCGIISFEPNIGVGADGRPIEAGIGLASFEIPIVATGIFENITGFEFQLDYPRFVTIDGVTEMDGAAADRKSALIRDLDVEIDPDPDGDRRVSGTVVLARLTGRIEVDFALRERSPETLVLSGTKLRFAGGEFRDVGPPSSGQLLLSDRYVVLDRVETDVGSTEPVTVAVRLTFQAPDGAPDYKFNAFQVHIEFDPEELTLLPVTLEDQVGTAIEGEGFLVLPGQNSLARANEMGDFLIAWLGFDFSNPTVPTFLEPVVDERLVVLKFRSRLPATSPEVFSSISFITDRSRGQPTAFFPVEDVPGVPDLRSFFPGGVLQRSSVPDLNVAAVVPARGALTGGNRVSLLGSGFPTAPDAGLTIQLRSPIGELLHVDPATVERLGSGELSFEVPDSGLRASSFVGSIPFDIQVHAQFPEGLAEGFLRRGYRYEAPVLVSADVGSVHAMASDLVSLTGRGLAHDARVEFRVDGFATPFPADIFRRDDDGSGIVIVASGLPGPAAGEPFRLADLSVVQSEAPDSTAETVLTLGERIRILPATGDVGLRISDVLPGSASHCGGETLTILGDGFTDSTEVRFGDVPAVSVQRRSSRELLAVVPFFDSPRVVALRLLDAGLLAESPYELTEPPDFRRGDVDGDGRINMTDATRLANMVLGSAEPPGGQPNRDAWDVDDNGEVDFADAIWLLRFLFEGGPPPLDPFVAAGQDPSNLADGICQ
ncbi:MAG: dockerin type I domain-containing protein, partial [Planctomycetota bacterium]|nr:dockerin type I domain-containing protein [Planctomycetota bacterium]